MNHSLAYQKYLNFAGKPLVRLRRNQAIYRDSRHQRSLLIAILSPLLFFGPDAHHRKLEGIYVDQLINQVHWGPFVESLQREWDSNTLYVRNYPHASLTTYIIDAHSQVTLLRTSLVNQDIRFCLFI